MTLRVRILAYDGVEALDFAGPFEVFTTASRVSQRMNPGAPAPFEVASVALGANEPVQARAGLRLLADHDLAANPMADLLVVPGGVVDAPMASPATLRWIADCAAGAQLVASVCTGVFLLAKSGVAVREAVTTHWEDIADLRGQFPLLDVRENERWVDSGRIVSSAGISAGIDMSLYLVERLAGRPLAERTARQMDYAWISSSSSSKSPSA
ncbi:DJ-1/PfpI family protein [Variovorax paradoxus]|uniref:Transcriptional regulator GlxA family with amidase domain n=1 Tax=Variovorax paradoxus TaxID=34073 RepID=A0AAW8EPU9_VARPD|nr:DJ-1/PfpI family protein [Variovorax paradoxus]MDP9973987.1 transcriptional regulator GlxA family with amidase domain [Variovorax paradoxus]